LVSLCRDASLTMSDRIFAPAKTLPLPLLLQDLEWCEDLIGVT
jgi:hypothetical protein